MNNVNISSFIWSVADLLRTSGQLFFNTSPLDMKKLTSFMLGDSESGVPMQGLYDTLETYCYHGLQ
ncbi:hypothetical protein KKC22_20640 [Myxococcota bacterium]|nr:hypothetical protein [Myxococcota bacterium]